MQPAASRPAKGGIGKHRVRILQSPQEQLLDPSQLKALAKAVNVPADRRLREAELLADLSGAHATHDHAGYFRLPRGKADQYVPSLQSR